MYKIVEFSLNFILLMASLIPFLLLEIYILIRGNNAFTNSYELAWRFWCGPRISRLQFLLKKMNNYIKIRLINLSFSFWWNPHFLKKWQSCMYYIPVIRGILNNDLIKELYIEVFLPLPTSLNFSPLTVCDGALTFWNIKAENNHWYSCLTYHGSLL
jgi:hypothetical protein